jgi:3-methyladenine DNA glycosylase AlkD
MTHKDVERDLNKVKDKNKAKVLQGYFKTGEGEYGAGDSFLGVTVPLQRNIAKKYWRLSLAEIEKLLEMNVHEYRFTALEILVMRYESGDEEEKKNIVKFYLKNRRYVNNWDLVDTSARYILGEHLLLKHREILFKLAQSKNMWDRRIAIIATHTFIMENDFGDTFRLAEIYLNDPEDLIHKAVGWMLREVGNQDKKSLTSFLNKNYKKMPRTMLRYAIEKFEPNLRKKFLRK